MAINQLEKGTVASKTWVFAMPSEEDDALPMVPWREQKTWQDDMQQAGFTHLEFLPAQYVLDGRFRVVTAVAEVRVETSVQVAKRMNDLLCDLRAVLIHTKKWNRKISEIRRDYVLAIKREERKQSE